MAQFDINNSQDGAQRCTKTNLKRNASDTAWMSFSRQLFNDVCQAGPHEARQWVNQTYLKRHLFQGSGGGGSWTTHWSSFFVYYWASLKKLGCSFWVFFGLVLFVASKVIKNMHFQNEVLNKVLFS